MSKLLHRLQLWGQRCIYRYWWWAYRDIPDDVCCCGDYMERHGYDDGHMPVSGRANAVARKMRLWPYNDKPAGKESEG